VNQTVRKVKKNSNLIAVEYQLFFVFLNMPLHGMQKRAGKKSLNRRIKAAGKHPLARQFWFSCSALNICLLRIKSMADIFDEINEEMKQDRMKALWQRFGKYVIAVVVAVVAGVSLTQGYGYFTQQRDARSADVFFNAVLSDDVAGTLEAFTEELSDGYVLLAEFRLAAALAENDRAAEAEQHYLSLAARDDIQQIYRDIALLLSVIQAPVSAQASTLQTRLDTLVSSVSPLKGLALEQAAALDVRRGNTAAAIGKLNELVELTDIPTSLRQRALQILTVLDKSRIKG